MSEEQIPVLYIGGYSRSGSTLLLRMLGQIEGLFPVGEMWDIWQRSFSENQLCGCGKPFNECPFWTAVVEETFGSLGQVDVAEMQALRHAVQGRPSLPQLMVPALRTPAYREKLEAYSTILGRLYRTIKKLSGCRVIVDSSKVAPYAFLLGTVPGVQLSVLHLVRDSRATAYSWQRKKRRPEIHWKTAYMEQYSPVRSALEWELMNGLLQTLQATQVPYRRLRYEDVVTQPESVLHQTVDLLGLPDLRVHFHGGEQTMLVGVDHTVSGNPDRFTQGAIKIRPDTEWQEKMSDGDKLLVTALTWPLLLNYGYFRRSHPAPATEQPVISGQ